MVGVRATGDLRRFVALQLDHGSGVTSSVVLSGHTPLEPGRAGVELYGPAGVLEVDCTSAVSEVSFATLRRELAEVVAGAPHPLDVRRGLHLQRWLHEAERQLLPAR